MSCILYDEELSDFSGRQNSLNYSLFFAEQLRSKSDTYQLCF